MKSNDKILPISLGAGVLLFLLSIFVCAQGSPETQSKKDAEAKLLFIDTHTVQINKDHTALPVWIQSSESVVRSVRVNIPIIISPYGEFVTLNHQVVPDTVDISPDSIGAIFSIKFDRSEIEKIEYGKYTATILITAKNAKPITKQCHFEVTASRTFMSSIPYFVQWMRNNLIIVFRKIIEIIFFGFLIFFVIWFFRVILKSRHSLNILPVANETGESGELEGVASGIDDLLYNKLYEIGRLSSIYELKYFDVASSAEVGKSDEKRKAPAQTLTVLGGEFLIELQKIPDISIGPVKIPLGTIIAFLTKIFGGNYVSGALQKYGGISVIVLHLEHRPLLFFSKRTMEVEHFEVTWTKEDIKKEKLSEGVPGVIEQLAYKIFLAHAKAYAKKIGTQNWLAYKYFLKGLDAFGDYERNKTRRDCLEDAISCWYECVRLDEYFAKGHHNLGTALDIKGKYSDAIFHYQKAIELDPELVGAELHYNLAKLYWDVYKDRSRTLDEIKKAKKLNPYFPHSYNLEGLIYTDSHEYGKEVIQYSKAIKLSRKDPKPVFYYNLSVAKYHSRDYDAAQTAGEYALEIFKKKGKEPLVDLLQTMGWIHNQKGEVALTSGDNAKAQCEYKKALDYFQKGLIKEPERWGLLYGCGIALRESGYLEGALLLQCRQIRLWPQYDAQYAELVKTLRGLKRPENETIPYEHIGFLLYDKKIPENKEQLEEMFIPKNETLRGFEMYIGVLGGILQYYFKDYSRAVTFYKRIFQSQSKEAIYVLKPEFLHNFGRALMHCGDDSYKKASQCLKQAASLYHESQYFDIAECYSDLADTYLKLGHYEKADTAYQTAICFYKKANLDNFASKTQVKYAKCLMDWYWNGGDLQCYNRAREECDKAILLNNTNYDAFHVKGNTYYDLGFDADALHHYEKAMQINFDSPGSHYNLGLCYLNMGKYEEAVKKFETTVKLDEKYADPDNLGNPDPYEKVSYCLEKQGQLDKVVEILRKVINIFPTSVKYHILLGEYLQKQDCIDEAADQYKKALSSDVNNSQGLNHWALNYLADLYAENGADIDEAYRMARSALILCKAKVKSTKDLGLERELSSIRNTLGWVFYQKNLTKKAMVFLKKSLVHVLKEPKNHARMALVYEKYTKEITDKVIKGDYLEKAKDQWRIVLDLGEQNKWSKIAEERLKVLSGLQGEE